MKLFVDEVLGLNARLPDELVRVLQLVPRVAVEQRLLLRVTYLIAIEWCPSFVAMMPLPATHQLIQLDQCVACQPNNFER